MARAVPAVTAPAAIGWRDRLRQRVAAPRSLALAAALVLAGGALVLALPAIGAGAWAARVAVAAAAVIAVPGTLTVLAWRPQPALGLLELLAHGLACSFVLIQGLTVLALTFHWSPVVSLAILAAWSIVHAALALRRTPGLRVQVSGRDVALGCLMLVIGAMLYVAGSPFASGEDRIHISIIRRLAALATPSLGNIYFTPVIVYTYPFPGTHYLFALVSRVGDIDPLFLYYRARAFLGVASLVLLYGCARVAFANARLAWSATLVAACFVINGTFERVPNLYWAQLAPFSHASDVAMGVLLPALLLQGLAYLDAGSRRAQAFFLITTVGMLVMLAFVHVREAVQFVMYLAAGSLALLVLRQHPVARRRALWLLAVSVIVLVMYRLWQGWVVPSVDTLVADRRADLQHLAFTSPWRRLFAQPLLLMDSYMPKFEVTFLGWTPLVLLASPVALAILRRHAAAWIMGASIVVYMLIVRYPALAIPYVYATYFEMLFTPVRNVIFFVHVLTGVCLYLAAASLARTRWVVMIGGALVMSVVVIEVFRYLGPAAAAHIDLLFAPLLAAYAVTAVYLWRRRGEPAADGWIERPRRRWILAFVLVLVPVAIQTETAENWVRDLRFSTRTATPDALVASLDCLPPVPGEAVTFCAPPLPLMRFARQRIPVTAVFASDRLDPYQPSMFFPQQMGMWTGRLEGFVEEEKLFAAYFRHYRRAMDAYNVQPFFNDRDTDAERDAFIHDLGITHVLVNPRSYALMTAVLARNPQRYVKQYDVSQWAIYEVKR